MFNNDKFMKGFDINPNKFFDGYVPLKTVTYCVVVIYDNNYRKEIYGIENPWMFMKAMKKNVNVKNCFILDENNS